MATAIIMNGNTIARFALLNLSVCGNKTLAVQSSCYSMKSNNNSNNNNPTPPTNTLTVGTNSSGDIKKSVFISQSYNVFTNLALEDWIYKNYDFANHHILMLWANDPCVVIGRHQNPYMEANISNLTRNGITLARRNSGGGAVYHDRGNLNCTFFTARERYNRNYNLNILTRALFREWGINAKVSERDDIVLDEKKVSQFYKPIKLERS